MKNKKSLGQHWLYNRTILDTIAEEAAGIGGPSDTLKAVRPSLRSEEPPMPAVTTVVEIGPGLGTLTSSLLRRFDKVVAVEFDERLAQNLPGSFPGKNLEVVNADILEFDFGTIKEPYAVAGNIPYYITSPIIRKLITLENRPEKIVLLVQKEVAERVADEKETMLSLLVKNYADVALGPVVKKDEFTPPPKVDSRVLILTPHAPVVSEEVLDLIAKAFKEPRKKLAHNLAGVRSKEELKQILKELGIDENARPADLHLEDYNKLINMI